MLKPLLAIAVLLSLPYLPLPAMAQDAAPASPASPASAASTAPAANPQVRMETTMGTITLELFPDKAPRTVANFLRYVHQHFYAGTVFHRVIPGFLIQAGIYDTHLQARRTRPAIPDEADNGLSNLRGTIAAARAPEAPDSATSQFFINLVDNQRLDFVSKQSGLTWGYAVFGKVVKGMDVVDKIAALPTVAMGPFSGDVPQPLVTITGVSVIGEEPAAAASAPAPAASAKPAAAKPAAAKQPRTSASHASAKH
ncbi:MAG TPA: peptidylprolyl isomerase [Rhodanobacteraceae bacterium]|nr:peptidylprolyl isomerase [Rhodanobacteraceae bacterium]